MSGVLPGLFSRENRASISSNIKPKNDQEEDIGRDGGREERGRESEREGGRVREWEGERVRERERERRRGRE